MDRASGTGAGAGAAGLPSCTVVVCTRDRPVALDACLEALSRVVYPDFGVLVVDNGSGGGGARDVAARRGARYVTAPIEGVSRARNLGARVSSTDVLAYLDDDAVPDPGWLAALAVEFRRPEVMAVVGRVQPSSLATDAERLSAAANLFGTALPERRVFDRTTPRWFELANFGGIGIGANMAFRRRAFDLWPGFDERLGYGAAVGGGEEHFAFFSLIHLGYSVVFTPRATVRHPYPRSMDELTAKHLRTVASSMAYAVRLLVEVPGYRWATLRFLARWLVGTSLAELRAEEKIRSRLAPPWRVAGALLRGPLLYARSRMPVAVAAGGRATDGTARGTAGGAARRLDGVVAPAAGRPASPDPALTAR